jgi:hypothetical protein
VSRLDSFEDQNNPSFNQTKEYVLKNTNSHLRLQPTNRHLKDEDSEIADVEAIHPQFPDESMVTVIQNK